MINETYLSRLAERQKQAGLKRQVVFGLLIGWLGALGGGYLYEFVPNVNDRLCLAVFWFGVAILIITLIVPAALSPLERLQRKIGSTVFLWAFNIILSLIYGLFFWPIGALMRKCHSRYVPTTWDRDCPEESSQWEAKKLISAGVVRSTAGKQNLFSTPWQVVQFFFRQGHYAMIPALIILILIGFILIFIQVSALAPFIYTLF